MEQVASTRLKQTPKNTGGTPTYAHRNHRDLLTLALEVSMNRVICIATKMTRAAWLSKSAHTCFNQIGRAGPLSCREVGPSQSARIVMWQVIAKVPEARAYIHNSKVWIVCVFCACFRAANCPHRITWCAVCTTMRSLQFIRGGVRCYGRGCSPSELLPRL